MTARSRQSPPRLPLVLLGLMTVATFAGPFVIALVIGGGRRSSWPPDRPVEWWTFGLICGAVVVLMAACLVLALRAGQGRRHDGAISPAGRHEPARDDGLTESARPSSSAGAEPTP